MVDYKSVSWNQSDLTTRDKLTRMANNDEYLKTKMPSVRYTYGTPVDDNCKILVGRILVGSQSSRSWHSNPPISFGTFFNPSCSPIISLTAISDREDEMYLRATGIGQLKPTSTGMVIRALVGKASGKKKNIEKSFYIDWTATGF